LARLKPLWLWLRPIAARLKRSRRLLVALDFDGTLAPIVDHPELAVLPARTRRVVGLLSRLEDAEVAILSGRPLRDLRRKVGLERVFLAGTAGLETHAPGTEPEVHVPRARRLPAALRQRAPEWCRRFPGTWVEDKRLALALHYRQLAPGRRGAFAAGVRRMLAPFREQVVLVRGKMVLELLPDVGWDKARALRRWWGSRSGSTLFFLGDDAHDEPAHALARRHGAVSVAVGRTLSRAEFMLSSSEEVTWFLEWLLSEWRARDGSA
jgi:trehalose-phosphatase